ncbi:MAG: acylphosphatase [Candidatus Sericytochromatia bacterium]|nr:acylphosphatase [Candidatus Tanganyikabacteria bacterium]
MADRRLHVRVDGEVGRAWAAPALRDQALRLGVRGWARRLSDTRFECVAEGAPEALEALLAWCRGGPPMATVTSVDARWFDATGDFRRFDVRS